MILDLFKLMISLEKDLSKFLISLAAAARAKEEDVLACWDPGYTYMDWGGEVLGTKGSTT